MNFQQLEYFLTVAEVGYITEAAQKLYIAQPALSRSLQRLERELGVVLFVRSTRGLQLTDAGKVLHQKGNLLLKNYADMLSLVREAETGAQGTVRIGTRYTTVPLLSSKINSIKNKYSSVEFRIVQEDPDELIELLRKGKVDIILLPHLYDDPAFSVIPLEPDPLVLVVNPTLDPVPQRDSIPVKMLENIPFCMMRSGDFYGYNEILVAECQRNGFNPRIFCQCNSAATVMILAAQGLGLSYQPKMVIDAMRSTQLYSKRIEGFERYTYPVILQNRDAIISGATQTFLSQFKEDTHICESGYQEVISIGQQEDISKRERAFPCDTERS